MHIAELTVEEFMNFQENHELSNYYQTINYALLMSEKGFEYDLIGYKDSDGNILAASLILLKYLSYKCYYGYAPRGFLIDYKNADLVSKFTKDLSDYYYKKRVSFIKINPYIVIGKLNNNSLDVFENENKYLQEFLSGLNYKKLMDNLYFESQEPRFEGIINLKEFNFNNLDKNTKNKIRKGVRKGLTLEKVDKNKLNVFYNFVKNKYDLNEYYYQDLYTAFDKNDKVDLFLVSINYNAFLQNSEDKYSKELDKNTILNEKLANNSFNKVINAKMQSDKNLLNYKNDIMEATKNLNSNEKIYIAGALVIKHNNTINIVESGYDIRFKRFVPNYFLYYTLMDYYKNDYDYLNIGGLVGDFKNDNKYTGLNKFKLGFNPIVYEYAGEFDLIIEEKAYEVLLQEGILAKELNKKEK